MRKRKKEESTKEVAIYLGWLLWSVTHSKPLVFILYFGGHCHLFFVTFPNQSLIQQQLRSCGGAKVSMVVMGGCGGEEIDGSEEGGG
jgi:hypothetical protein